MPKTESYDEYPFDRNLHPGWTGWFLFRNGAELSVTGSPVAPQQDPRVAAVRNPVEGYDLIIRPGWNQVGNPYDHDVNISDIMVYDDEHEAVGLLDEANRVTQQAFWFYSNGEYGLARGLGPGEGGWIRKLTPGVGVVFFPAAPSASVDTSTLLLPPHGLEQPRSRPTGCPTSMAAAGRHRRRFIEKLLP